MEIGKNWAFSLTGGILGLFSLGLPWFGIETASKLPGTSIHGVSPFDLLKLDWLTAGDSVLTTTGLSTILVLIFLAAIVAFIAGCFLSIAGRKGSLLMLASNIAAFLVILFGLLTGANPVLVPHYGGLVGFVAGFVSFVGIPVREELRNLTEAQWSIVDMVAGSPGLSRAEIAEMIGGSAPLLLDDLDALERKGIVFVESSREGPRVYTSPGISKRLRREMNPGDGMTLSPPSIE